MSPALLCAARWISSVFSDVNHWVVSREESHAGSADCNNIGATTQSATSQGSQECNPPLAVVVCGGSAKSTTPLQTLPRSCSCRIEVGATRASRQKRYPLCRDRSSASHRARMRQMINESRQCISIRCCSGGAREPPLLRPLSLLYDSHSAHKTLPCVQ